MKFWRLICKLGSKFWVIFPKCMRALHPTGHGANSFLKHLVCILRAGPEQEKELRPDSLPLSQRALRKDRLTATGESRLGHFMSKFPMICQDYPTHPCSFTAGAWDRPEVQWAPQSESGTFSRPAASPKTSFVLSPSPLSTSPFLLSPLYSCFPSGNPRPCSTVFYCVNSSI